MSVQPIETINILDSAKKENIKKIFGFVIGYIITIFICVYTVKDLLSGGIKTFGSFFLISFVFFMFLMILLEKRKVKLIISAEKIEFFKNNELEFRLFWKDLKKIEVGIEKYLVTVMYPIRPFIHAHKEREGMRINFIGTKNTRPLQLYHYPFRKKRIQKILTTLETFSKVLDKEYKSVGGLQENREYDEILAQYDTTLEKKKKTFDDMLLSLDKTLKESEKENNS